MEQKRRKVPYLQMDRMARIMFYLQNCKVDEGKSKNQLILKSALISGLLNNTFSDKLQVEAATLSYVPQFCEKWDKKGMAQNFGQDVKNLVLETSELLNEFHRMQFEEDYEADVHLFSQRSKELLLFQCYADLSDAFTVKRKMIVFEGKECHIKRNQRCWIGEDNTPYMLDHFEETKSRKRRGKKETIGITDEGEEVVVTKGKCDIIMDTEGDWVPKPDFDRYLIDILEWKMEVLKYSGMAIREALEFTIMQYKKKQGFDFQLKTDTSHPNAMQKQEPYYDKEAVYGPSE